MTAAPAPLAGPVEIDPDDKPTLLYRLFDAEWNLLYIGVAFDLAKRLWEHASAQMWWPEVAHCTAALYGNREDAEAAEDAAIKAERPKCNVRGALGPERPRSAQQWTRPERMRADLAAGLWVHTPIGSTRSKIHGGGGDSA